MAPPSDSSPVKVAFIDNDTGLVTVLNRRLAALRWQSEVLQYAPGPEQLTALRLHALLLNPALTGLDYIERISSTMPALALVVISAPAPVGDRVRGLRAGADDWITKPVHPEEIVARIQAVLRRRRGELPLDQEPIVAGEITIRPDMFDAYAGDEPAGLSRKEYELLWELAEAAGRVLEREHIYQRVWGYTMVRGDRSVDVFVRKLRTKLERISPNWRYVHTHFGVGYRFAAERDEGSEPAASAAAEPAAQTPPADPAGDAPRVASEPPGELNRRQPTGADAQPVGLDELLVR
jgi:DNA-binding response OmpR family regulator